MIKLIKLIEKYIYIYLVACFLGISAIIIFVNQGTVSEKLNLILTCLIYMLFARYGVYLVLWVQLKNPMSSEKFLTFAINFFIIVPLIFSILSIIFIFNDYKNYSTYFELLAFSFTSSGAIRFKRKNEKLINQKYNRFLKL